MKKHKWIIGTMVILMFSLNACKDDDDPLPQELKRTYALAPVSDPDISGKVTFTKVDAKTNIILVLAISV